MKFFAGFLLGALLMLLTIMGVGTTYIDVLTEKAHSFTSDFGVE